MQYPFEEIYLMGEGLYASGTATLESAGDGYDGEFYVTSITFDKGPTLSRANMLKGTFNRMLFERIASEIEASDAAAEAFAEEEQGMREGVADFRRTTFTRSSVYSDTHERRLIAYIDTLPGHPVKGASLEHNHGAAE